MCWDAVLAAGVMRHRFGVDDDDEDIVTTMEPKDAAECVCAIEDALGYEALESFDYLNTPLTATNIMFFVAKRRLN